MKPFELHLQWERCYTNKMWLFLQSSAGPSDRTDSRGMKRKADDSDSEPEPEDNVR